MRQSTAEALGKVGPAAAAAMPALIAAFGDGDMRVRQSAAAAVGRVGPAAAAAVPALIATLGDRDIQMRRSAAAALGQVGPAAAAAVPALIAAFSDANWYASAVEAVARIGAATVSPLIVALSDGDMQVRRSAAKALGKVGPAAVPALIATLSDTDENARRSAAEALALIGPAAVPALIVALADTDENVRINAAEALGQIGAPEAALPLDVGRVLHEPGWDAETRFRWSAAEVLARIGPMAAEAVLALIAALGDADKNVRANAAKALSAIGPAEVAAVRHGIAEATATPRSSTNPVAPSAEPVDAAVFSPLRVAKDSVFLIQVFLYPPNAEYKVDDQARKMDAAAERRGTYSLPLDLPPSTRVDLRLEMPNLTVNEADAVLTWRGRPTAAQFEVTVPAAAPGTEAIGRIRFAVAGVPAGTLRFKVALAARGRCGTLSLGLRLLFRAGPGRGAAEGAGVPHRRPECFPGQS